MRMMQTLLQDIRYGLRMLRKAPGLTAVILIMLTLGIGATTAVFTIFDAILLRPLAYEKPDELVQLWEKRTDGPFQQSEFSYPDYLDVKQQNKVFSQMGGYARNSVTLSGKDGAEQLEAAVATADFFETLGVRPVLGRTFKAGEDELRKNIPVMLTYGAWQRRFGGDAAVIGKTLVIDGDLASVVGVLPRNFVFAPTRSADLWISARLDEYSLRRNAYWLHPVARLKPGVTLQQAQAEIQTLSSRLAMQYPDSNVGVSSEAVNLRQEIVGQVQPVLLVLMAAIGFVLLITCANVAGLLLARSLPRKKEISIRRALGARSTRIARQLLTEGILLALIGGSTGSLLAYWAVPAIISLLPQDILLSTPQIQELTVNAEALWFALGISLLTGVLFGSAPLVQTFNPNLQHELQEAGRGSVGSAHRLRNVLVISEMALAVVLLVGAGLMLKSLNRVLSTDPGFDTRNLLTGIVVLPGNKYPDGPKQLAFQQKLLERISSLPGVEQAGAVRTVPMSAKGSTSRFDVEGHPKSGGGQEYEANTPTVSQNYFSLMGIPLRAGRFFNSQDRDKSTHVVIVNQSMADMVFPNQNPIGKLINFTYTKETNYVQIVGVVANENINSLDAPPTPIVYECYEQNPNSYFSLVVRTKQEPASLVTAVTRAVRELEPEAPIFKVSSMAQIIATAPAMIVRAYPAYLIGGFSVLALLLAALGLYGVLAYSVAQRARELGVRMALGAQRSDLLKMVVRSGLQLAAIGIALGIVGGLITARLIASLLFGVAPTDATTFAGVCVVLFLAAMMASYVPAYRATKVDPMVALRNE
jgi:putative ABC transport system permease protein